MSNLDKVKNKDINNNDVFIVDFEQVNAGWAYDLFIILICILHTFFDFVISVVLFQWILENSLNTFDVFSFSQLIMVCTRGVI